MKKFRKARKHRRQKLSFDDRIIRKINAVRIRARNDYETGIISQTVYNNVIAALLYMVDQFEKE